MTSRDDHSPPAEFDDGSVTDDAGLETAFSPAPLLDGALPGAAMRLAVAVQAFTHNVVLGADIRFSTIEADMALPRADEPD